MRVICFSVNAELSLLRRSVLEANNILVDSPESAEEADMRLLEDNSYDVALLCHSLPLEMAKQLVTAFRRRNPAGCLIYITKTPWEKPPVKVDLFVAGIDGPDSLVHAVLGCKQHRS